MPILQQNIQDQIKYSVYTLSDPETLLVRYVGITGKPIQHRFLQHCKDHRKNNKKAQWIISLNKKGLIPFCEVIDESNLKEHAIILEMAYIKLFKALGARLTNLTIGGEGPREYKHTAEAKAKMSAKQKQVRREGRGRGPITEQEKINLSINRKGKPNPYNGKKREGVVSPFKGKKITAWPNGNKKRIEELEKLKMFMAYQESLCRFSLSESGTFNKYDPKNFGRTAPKTLARLDELAEIARCNGNKPKA